MDKKPVRSPLQVQDTKAAHPPMRFTDTELVELKKIFGGEHNLWRIKLLRKVFLPEYDPAAPLQQNIDLWMTVPIKDMTPEDALIRLISRNEVIAHIEQQLTQIHMLANREDETEGARQERLRKDSTQ